MIAEAIIIHGDSWQDCLEKETGIMWEGENFCREILCCEVKIVWKSTVALYQLKLLAANEDL